MAKRSGAGGIIMVAVILGLVTAYLIWNYLRQQDELKNRVPVVTAAVDIPPRATITPDMVTMRSIPPDLVAPDAVRDRKAVEGKKTKVRIRANEQVRTNDFMTTGEVTTLSYEVPPGMRAISIAAGEVQAVGTAVKPGDMVDILATFVDPINRQETTKTVLQMIKVLAVNRGNTDPNSKEGANSSMTLLVTPEQAEQLIAFDRQGTLRVALRPVQDDKTIDSAGVTLRDLRRAAIEPPPAPPTGTQTPVIISVPRERPDVIKVYRATQEQEVPVR